MRLSHPAHQTLLEILTPSSSSRPPCPGPRSARRASLIVLVERTDLLTQSLFRKTVFGEGEAPAEPTSQGLWALEEQTLNTILREQGINGYPLTLLSITGEIGR
jgi:hypothetical protein